MVCIAFALFLQFLQLGQEHLLPEFESKLPSNCRKRMWLTPQEQVWQEGHKCGPKGRDLAFSVCVRDPWYRFYLDYWPTDKVPPVKSLCMKYKGYLLQLWCSLHKTSCKCRHGWHSSAKRCSNMWNSYVLWAAVASLSTILRGGITLELAIGHPSKLPYYMLLSWIKAAG